MAKISEEDLKELLNPDRTVEEIKPSDDWGGFEKKDIPPDPVKIKKIKKIGEELAIGKVRRKITGLKNPPASQRDKPSGKIDILLKIIGFGGICGFVLFIGLSFPAYFAQLKWLYYNEYLGRRMPSPDGDAPAQAPPVVQITTPGPSPTPTVTAALTPPVALSAPTPAPITAPPASRTLPGDTNTLTIGKIALKAPIVWQVEEGEILDNLSGGVVHYKGTSLPGGEGNVFLVGHSSAYPWAAGEYGQVFSLLDKLVRGDRIEVAYRDKRYIYEVVEKKVISPTNVEVLKPSDKEILSLMTCWPIGTTLNRLIVQSELKTTLPLGG